MTIFVVVFSFYKMNVFISCCKSIDASNSVELFCKHVWTPFGILFIIILKTLLKYYFSHVWQ
jgi:hypothetical protein